MEEESRVEETSPSLKEGGTVEEAPAQKQQVNVLDVEVINENVALNILITFVNLAQKRGAFNLNESSKIWECIQQFRKSGSSEKTDGTL